MKHYFLLLFLLPQVLLAQDKALEEWLNTSTDVAAIDSVIFELEKETYTAEILGLAYHRLGAAYHKKKDLSKAISATRSALAIRANHSEVNETDLAASYFNLGFFYRKIGEHKKSLIHFQKALTLRLALNDPKLLGTYRNIANLYVDIGDYNHAAEELTLALKKSRELKGDNEKELAKINNDLARVYGELKQPKKALERFEASLRYYQAQNNKTPKIQRAKAICLLNISVQYLYLGEYDEALTKNQQAYDISLVQNAVETQVKCIMNFAVIFKRLGQFDKGLEVLEKGRKNAKDDRLLLAGILNNQADLYKQKGDDAQAEKQYLASIGAILSVKNLTDLSELKEQFNLVYEKSDLFGYVLDLARFYRHLAQKKEEKAPLQKALSAFEIADLLLEQMRHEQVEEASKLWWRANSRSLYQGAIETCYHLMDKEKAFYFMEKSRAALLLDEWRSDRAMTAVGIPDSILQAGKALREAIFEKESAFANNPENADLKAIALRAKHKLVQYRENLEAEFPKYKKMRYSTEPVSLLGAKAFLLGKKETIIEFFVADSAIFVLEIDGENVNFHRSEIPVDFDVKVQRFIHLVSNRQGDLSLMVQESRSIFQLLLGKLTTKNENLTIIPDNYLNYLPFELLLSKEVEGIPIKKWPYLLQEAYVNYANSATMYFLEERAKVATSTWLGLAPGDFLHPSLAPLESSVKEVEELSRQFSGSSLLREKATKAAFLAEAPSYGILHLSTHALSSPSPCIYFYDDSLTLQELYAQQFSAELVILSACETATGDLNTGEGVLSLGRGFAFAGVPSMITTLWSVNEGATDKLLKIFYQKLADGQAPHQALRNAKLAYLENADLTQLHPYFWAGLTHVGISVSKSNSRKKIYWIIGFLTILGVSVIFFKK